MGACHHELKPRLSSAGTLSRAGAKRAKLRANMRLLEENLAFLLLQSQECFSIENLQECAAALVYFFRIMIPSLAVAPVQQNN